MPDPFLTRLAQSPLLGDGATGTLLYAHGIAFEQCFDALNVDQPALVQELHKEYLSAGAEAIETNTFGANRFKLDEHGLAGTGHGNQRGGGAIGSGGGAAIGQKCVCPRGGRPPRGTSCSNGHGVASRGV